MIKCHKRNVVSFLENLFQSVLVSSNLYKQVISGLVDTSLRGVDTHGIKLVPHYIKAVQNGRINIKPKFSFNDSGDSVGTLNADHTFGIVAGNKAMELAIQKAKKTGVGIVSVYNSTHFSAAAIYSLLASDQNMIGMSFTNTDALVVPFGGKNAFLGTNPICFTAPCLDEDPFCLDMATSNTSWNNVLLSKALGSNLEKGWANDKNGKETLDPNDAVSLQAVGGYKGYGIGLMIEILCSMLTGMNFGPNIEPMYPLNKKKRGLGHFFMAIDIEKFQDINIFKTRMKQMLNLIRTQEAANKKEKVLVAGDKEKIAFKNRTEEGIPIAKTLLNEFNELARELNVSKLKCIN